MTTDRRPRLAHWLGLIPVSTIEPLTGAADFEARFAPVIHAGRVLSIVLACLVTAAHSPAASPLTPPCESARGTGRWPPPVFILVCLLGNRVRMAVQSLYFLAMALGLVTVFSVRGYHYYYQIFVEPWVIIGAAVGAENKTARSGRVSRCAAAAAPVPGGGNVAQFPVTDDAYGAGGDGAE